jgi:MinD superfamily P-loop ATPase
MTARTPGFFPESLTDVQEMDAMKELVVVSGKGGTGKTSIVASFAAMAERVVLADCDVDAADLHLVMAPTIKRREPFRAGHVARIQPGRCEACGTCADVCRFDAIRNGGRPPDNPFPSVDEIACEGCGVCVWSCPMKAIEFPENTSGEWFVSETRRGTMVHAKLGIAEENSGKLVTIIRKEARAIAEANGRDLVLVDGSPGIGCPVIASVTGADLVLLVAEPTVSGLHDLERVADLAAHLRLEAAVCVNKSDLNAEMAANIEKTALERGLRFFGRVPYDEDVTKAQIQGLSLVEFSQGQAAGAVRSVWRRVEQRLLEGRA